MATSCSLDSMFKLINQTLICASKYFNAPEIEKLHRLGIQHFGENRVQDLLYKKQALSHLDLTWHFIGHLQTNKVKQLINEIDYLHTLDRISLAENIQKYAQGVKKCFIQVNLTKEEQKSGLFQENLTQFINDIQKYDKINVIGLMTIGVYQDLEKTEDAFKLLNELAKKHQLPYLSMGMSDDYELAIKHGATHLRIGSKFKSLL